MALSDLIEEHVRSRQFEAPSLVLLGDRGIQPQPKDLAYSCLHTPALMLRLIAWGELGGGGICVVS